jgi:predicted GNAT family acetyltransferase
MALQTVTDPAQLRQVLDAALVADPLRNTILSSVVAGLDHDDAAGWAAHPVGQPLALAARSQLSTPLVVTAWWPDLDELADAVRPIVPAAVGGPAEIVEELVRRLGRPVTHRIGERLFRLDGLTAPRGAHGSARLAGTGDVELLTHWLRSFGSEALEQDRPSDIVRSLVRRMLARSRLWLWVDGGEPVSLAARHPAVHGIARVGPVYTPPERRGRGYASVVTAAASADVLRAGAVACLFTDLANPTSNNIYQALGYRPVLDRIELRLG